MVSAVPQTTNFALNKPPFDFRLYHDYINENFDVIDAVLNQYLAVQNVVGVWQNSTAYNVGERVIDSIVGTIYNCAIAHTSAATPTTFAQDRATNPTYWTSLSQAANARGAWAPATQYQTNDFVSSGNIFAVAIDAHVSGSVFASDSSHWAYLIDLSSFTLPSGVGKALQYLRQNAGETGLEYVTTTTLLAALNTPSVLALLASANTFTAGQTMTVPTGTAINAISASLGDMAAFVNTSAGASAGPGLYLFRSKAAGANNDAIGYIRWYGPSTTGTVRELGRILLQTITATDGAEVGEMRLGTMVAGTFTTKLAIRNGIFTFNATSGDMGVDTINAKGYFLDGAALGRLINTQYFTVAGTSTYTPTAGALKYRATVLGGGGAGGSCALTGGSQNAVGQPGGAGGLAIKSGLVTAISGATVTVGAKGAKAAAGNNAGGNGGTSSIGAVVSATGGNGGAGSAAFTPPASGNVGTGGTGSSGDLNITGAPGVPSIGLANAACTVGSGPSTYYGNGGAGYFTTTGGAGNNAGGFGAGGTGASNTQSQGAGLQGGDGSPGLVIIEEYA